MKKTQKRIKLYRFKINDCCVSKCFSTTSYLSIPSDDGYQSDSDRSFFEEGVDALTDTNVREIPDDQLHNYVNVAKDIVRHPHKAEIDGPEDQPSRDS